MRSLYDVLGVAKTATRNEIRLAYKKKAFVLHPDRGGGAEEMQELNLAYQCLSDPLRRKNYDETGQAGSQSILEQRVREILLRMFAQLISQNIERNCLQNVRHWIHAECQQIEQAQSNARAAKRKLISRRDKIRVKSGQNAFHVLIDSNLADVERVIVNNGEEMELRKAALEKLNDYESIEDAMDAQLLLGGSWVKVTTL